MIGDKLRQPAARCELSPCVGRYIHPEALGEVDVVARAVAAGWCKDAFGRLICPACRQSMPLWSAAPLVLQIKDQISQYGGA